jgi:Tfp pilus assembly protein PilF
VRERENEIMGRLYGLFGWLKRRWGRVVVACAALALVGAGLLIVSPQLLADRHLRRAKEALSRCRYAEARDELNQALRYRPGSATLHLLAARVARQMGKFEEAETHLQRCEALQGKQTDEQYLERLMLRAQSEDINEVLPALWEYVAQQKPQAPLVLEALTTAYLATTRNAAVQDCLTRWLDLEPDNIQALILQAVLAQRVGNPILATDCYTRALELDPDRTDIRLDLVWVLLAHGKHRQAVAHCNRLLEQDRNAHVALLALARARRGLGELPAARDCIERCLAVKPDYLDGLIEAAHLALDQQRYGDAEKYLRRALPLDPHNREVHYNLTVCLPHLGRAAEAAKHKRKVDQIDKEFFRREKLKAELSRRPEDPDLLYELGANCLRNGLGGEGLAWLRRALEAAPEHQPSHKLLTTYFENQGDKDRAAIHRTHVREK